MEFSNPPENIDWKAYANDMAKRYYDIANLLMRYRKECKCKKGDSWRERFDQENFTEKKKEIEEFFPSVNKKGRVK